MKLEVELMHEAPYWAALSVIISTISSLKQCSSTTSYPSLFDCNLCIEVFDIRFII